MALELEPGHNLDETYELVEVLGRGGMGEVWRARHLRLPKHVALKVLTVPTDLSDDAAVRFRREAEICSGLGHPNIIQVLDFNTLPDGRPYFVMELLEGEDLQARLERGPVSLEEFQAIVEPIVRGLAVAHAAGVVHRDLKPANIFLCRDPFQVKLLDFGISKMRDADTDLTQPSSMMGTPGYMAPEQVMGDIPEIGPHTDQFALAVVCYEMLSGKPAFSGDSLPQVVYKVVHEPAPALEETPAGPPGPPSMLAAIQRGMAKQWQARFPDVGSFADALLRVPAAPVTLTVDAGPAVSSGAADPAPRSPFRRLALPLAVLISVGLGGGIAYWDLARDDNRPANAAAMPQLESPTTSPAISDPTPKPTPATEEASPTSPRSPPKVADTPADGERPSESPPPEGSKPTSPESGRGSPKSGRGTRPSSPKLPGPAREALEQAEKALSRGRLDEALRLARRSVRIHESAQAIGLMGRVYCKRRDLGMANAMRRRLSGSKRRRLERQCRELGVRLGG